MSPKPTIRILTILSLLGILLGIGWQLSLHKQDSGDSKNRVIAKIGTHTITLHDVEHAAALRLYQADQQRDHLLHQAVQQLIEDELLKTEASRKGITVQELLATASQSESVARLANLPAPVKRLDHETHQTSPHLDETHAPEEQARIRQALLVSLRRQADILLSLPVTEPPVLPVDPDDDPSIGPADAPVTIIEFSDFQCPYCQKSVATLKELLRLYGDKIRVVYRDYPGPNHPQAVAAAEAAQCAGAQGRFWEYHDLLFERQTTITGWNYEALAQELNLHTGEFVTCLRSGRYREEIRKDLQDGLALGISSTPIFFINGRPLIGARPLMDFTSLIDKMLAETAASKR